MTWHTFQSRDRKGADACRPDRSLTVAAQYGATEVRP
jgi:hypothetical protein